MRASSYTSLVFFALQVFWSWTSPHQDWTASQPTTWWSRCPAWPGETAWSCCQSTSPDRTSSSSSTSSSCCRQVQPFTVVQLVTWCLTSLHLDTPAHDTATPLTSMVSVCVESCQNGIKWCFYSSTRQCLKVIITPTLTGNLQEVSKKPLQNAPNVFCTVAIMCFCPFNERHYNSWNIHSVKCDSFFFITLFVPSFILLVCVCPVDLISIDRRNPEREAECLERARVLSERFMEKVRDTDDHMWKPAGTNTAPTQTER